MQRLEPSVSLLAAAGMLLVAVAATVPGSRAVDASAGGPVESFGSGGLVTMGLNTGRSAETLTAIAVDDQGRAVAAGTVDTGERRVVYVSRRNGDGTPDTSFGTDGLVEIAQGPDVETSSVVGMGQLDGSTVLVINDVLVDSTYRSRVVKLAVNGRLDSRFGSGGTRTGLWGGHRVEQATVDAVGRVVVAGTRLDGSLFVSRMGTGGNLDPSFGTAGYTDVTGAWTGIEARDLVVSTNGAVTVCGQARTIENQSDAEGLVVRLDGGGVLEGGFGSGGILVLGGPGYDSVGACSVDASGRVVLALTSGVGEGTTAVVVQRRSGVSGAADLDFGTQGAAPVLLGSIVAPTGNEPYAEARAVEIMDDGRIAVGGAVMDATTSGFNEYLAILEETGTPATGFGTSGAVRLDATPAAGAVVSGVDETAGGLLLGSWRYGAGQDGYLTQVRTDGTPSDRFGQSGTVVLDLFEAQLDDRATSIDVDTSGGTVALGSWTDGESSGLRVVRLGPAGRLDPGFGTEGTVLLADPPGENLVPAVIRVGTDGRLTVLANGAGGVRVLRMLANGKLDSGFGVGGVATLPGTAASFLTAMSLLEDNRVAVVHFEVTGGDVIQYLSVLNASGGVDTGFGGTGRVQIRQEMWISDMVGRGSQILVAGHLATGTLRRPMLAVFSSNGSLSDSFGTDGVAVESGDSPRQSRSISSVALDSAGRVLVGGSSAEGGFVARFAPSGSLTGEFATNGYAMLDTVGDVVDLGLTAKGEILAYDGGQVLRLRRDGTVDEEFGSFGSSSAEPVLSGEMRVTNYVASIGGWVRTGYNADTAVLRVDATSTPDTPGDLRATARGTTMEVSWVGGTDGGASARYAVSTQPQSPGCETAATSCTLEHLSPGTSYLLSVRAVNRNGSSAPAEIEALTATETTEGAPVGDGPETTVAPGTGEDLPPTVVAGTTSGPGRVRVTAVDRGLVVRFTTVNGAQRYVATATPGNLRCVTDGAKPSCVIRGLRPWVSYAVHVVAEGAWGVSGSSPAVTGRPLRTLRRGSSTPLNALAGVRGPTMIWTVRGGCRVERSGWRLIAPGRRTTCVLRGRDRRASVAVTILVS